MPQITEVPYAGTYRVRTGQRALKEAFERLLPHVSDLLDLPPEMAMAGATMDSVLDGSFVPDVDSMDEVDQASLCIPMMNAVGMLTEAHGRGAADLCQGACDIMSRVSPVVAWVALRNSMAWESTNRRSREMKGVPSHKTWGPLLTSDGWLGVCIRIREAPIWDL